MQHCQVTGPVRVCVLQVSYPHLWLHAGLFVAFPCCVPEGGEHCVQFLLGVLAALARLLTAGLATEQQYLLCEWVPGLPVKLASSNIASQSTLTASMHSLLHL
jgi:hypothetical protein